MREPIEHRSIVTPSRAPFRTLEPQVEREYRAFRRPEEMQSLGVTGAVVAVLLLLFGIADHRLVEPESVLFALLALRVVVVGLIGAAFLVSRSDVDHRRRDLWVTACAFGLVVTDTAAAVSRPAGFTGNVAMSPVIALLLYVAVPGPQRALTVAAMTESVGAVTATVQNGATPQILFSLVGALTLANALGLVAMRRMNHWGREQFLAFRSLGVTNQSLKAALAEVRALRQIIPVCASCKRVRDDEGFWERVEVYISRQTGGDVSHGICPECYQELYGYLEDEGETEGVTRE